MYRQAFSALGRFRRPICIYSRNFSKNRTIQFGEDIGQSSLLEVDELVLDVKFIVPFLKSVTQRRVKNRGTFPL